MMVEKDDNWRTLNRQLATFRGQLTRRINEGEKLIPKLNAKADKLNEGLSEFADMNGIVKSIAEVARKVEDKSSEIASLCETDTAELDTLNNGLTADTDRAEAAKDKFILATEYLRKQRLAKADIAVPRATGEEGSARGNFKDVTVACHYFSKT